jgi:hypothetical protein
MLTYVHFYISKIIDSIELDYIVVNFFEHPQKCRHWPRSVRNVAVNVCEALIAKNCMIPETTEFCRSFIAKLRSLPREHINTPVLSDSEVFSLSDIVLMPLDDITTSATDDIPTFPQDIDCNMDLFMQFSPLYYV